MYPYQMKHLLRETSFPRTRGDVPSGTYDGKIKIQFPPHTRGCTQKRIGIMALIKVSPAHAGMYRRHRRNHGCRRCFPRTRGDVPGATKVWGIDTEFPPHTRGCTLGRISTVISDRVSPAHAGMYPSKPGWKPRMYRFPRTRGDVPINKSIPPVNIMFPPHTRGCTHDPHRPEDVKKVSPAHAGMYPVGRSPPIRFIRFPRTRGDVPGSRRGG